MSKFFPFPPDNSKTANFQYKGEDLDDKTGLYFMRVRYYDPATGGFISRDPVEGILNLPQTQNSYNFTNGNPINFSDPSGLDVYGICANANIAFPVYNGCSVCANYSSNEKTFFPSATLGLGGSTGIALGIGASGLYSNAKNINSFLGKDIFGGLSFGEGVEANGEISVDKDDPSIRSDSLGLGLGANFTLPVLPGEAHGGISNTW